jgi:anti-anti-sigma factor
MSRNAFALGWSSEAEARSAAVFRGSCSESACVVYIRGPLRIPINRDLRETVRELLRQGKRRLVLDLTDVSRIDAAGVGMLVRAYNMTTAVNGVLRIEHTTPCVREILKRVGLFGILTGGNRERQ